MIVEWVKNVHIRVLGLDFNTLDSQVQSFRVNTAYWTLSLVCIWKCRKLGAYRHLSCTLAWNNITTVKADQQVIVLKQSKDIKYIFAKWTMVPSFEVGMLQLCGQHLRYQSHQQHLTTYSVDNGMSYCGVKNCSLSVQKKPDPGPS